MEKRHFEQAKVWLEGARHVANLQQDENFAVGVSMLIHAVIKANDALTLKFLNQTAKRHDDARRLFDELIRRNFLKSEYAVCSQTIQDAINNKAKAEYRGGYFSKSDFEVLQRKAGKFLEMVKSAIS